WLFWLRDPPKGLPRSRTTPPEGISPAAAHYLANKEYDDLTLVCALTSLASKGFLVLQSLGPKTAYSADYIWAVSKQDDAPSKELSKDEKAVSRLIFSYETTVKLSKDNREHLKNLRSEHEETLQTELDDSHIQSHFRFFWLAIGLYLLAVSGVAWWLHGEPTDLFFVGLLFGIAGMELLFNGISKLNRRSNIPVGEVLATLFFLAWSGAALFTVWKFLSPEVLVFMFVLRLLNRWFCGKNQTYTVEGRKVMDQLEGFREHLLPTPSKATSSLSGTGARRSTAEQWFPYAVALGVEQEWRAAADNSPATPDWLEGVALADLAVFGAALSATVAAATFTPSYGHGGHGGGFGGGGGGGGGDGGGGGGH
ncbi:MAG: hypothetical protein VX610_07840, partial [SAR324 cluster bacterium]|nr:hypothetical protein [SAR324 cluster bacterium]